MTENKVKKEYGKMKELVAKILQRNPLARENDTLLFIDCAEELGASTLRDLLNIKLSMHTVIRVRRLLQAEGLYLASDEVRNKRNARSWNIKKLLGSDSLDKLSA